MTCRVQGCRHSTYHTTVAHRCGACGEFGHGRMECQNPRERERLSRYHGETINFLRRCTVPNCPHPETHSTQSHHCTKCGNLHQEDNCIIQNLDVHMARFNQEHYLNYFQPMNFANVHRDHNVVVPIQLGLGSQLFVRMKDGIMTSLFMHQDSWGQYGPSQDLDVYREYVLDCLILDDNSFCQLPYPEPGPDINNLYNDVEEEINIREIQCPLCRTVNLEDQVLTAYGLEVRCSVCMDANVDRFFQACGHACVCHTCLEHL